MISRDGDASMGGDSQNESALGAGSDSLTNFVFGSEELTERTKRIRAILAAKKHAKKDDVAANAHDQAVLLKAHQTELEADERYIAVREVLNHPDIDILLTEMQDYVEGYISEMLRKATAGAAQQPPERAEKYLQERTDFTLKSYGIKDRAWHRHRHMGSLYRSDQKIEEKLQGIVILELRGYYPPSEGPHSTVWDLRLDVRWNSHTQQMVMSLYDSSSDQWTEVSGFDYLLELAAELMSKPPILWSKEINSWRKKVSGSLDEAYHIFCQMLREDRNLAHKVIYYGDLSDHTFYGLNSMGIFDEVMSVIKAIDAELEPIKLLRRIANNTDSIAATSAISAMGTVALGRLTAQNSQILDTISGKISALGDGKRR